MWLKLFKDHWRCDMHICGIGIEKWECVLLFANSLMINILSYWEKSYLVDSRPFWQNWFHHSPIAEMIISDSLRNQAPTHISNIFSRWHCDRLHSGLMVGPPLPWLHNYWYIRFWRKKFWMKSAFQDAPQFLLPFPTHFLTNMPFDVTWIFVVPCSVSVIGACYMPSWIWPAINRESLL